MSGSWPHIAEIYDADGIFDGMQSGTKGRVLFQEGKYWIIQAKCDPEDLEDCECDPDGDDDCECSA
jgi:hypothetical protein